LQNASFFEMIACIELVMDTINPIGEPLSLLFDMAISRHISRSQSSAAHPKANRSLRQDLFLLADRRMGGIKKELNDVRFQ
jgi:hypothetical protein